MDKGVERMTECNAIIEANNEIDELKRENKELNKLCVTYGFEMGKLEEENEQLKQQKDKWKQQCIHFKEMLDDMDIAYLCDEWIYGELKGDLE